MRILNPRYQFYHRLAFLYVRLFGKDKISYSSNKEDVIIDILTGFKQNGVYIDVGANHPDIISVTKKFYDRGWSGVNIEPNYDNYLLFLEKRKRDINLNFGIAEKEGEADFFFKPNATTAESTGFTFSKKVYDERGHDLKSKKVKMMPLRKVFEDNGLVSVDFINIDTEGFENEVLKSNDWKKYKARVLCVEGKGYDKFLKQFGYKKALFDGINTYYVLNDDNHF